MTDDAEAGKPAGLRRSCPGCEAKIPVDANRCPECDADVRKILRERRLGPPDPRTLGETGGMNPMVYAAAAMVVVVYQVAVRAVGWELYEGPYTVPRLAIDFAVGAAVFGAAALVSRAIYGAPR